MDTPSKEFQARPKIAVRKLKGLNVFFDNDLYELALFTLKLHVARDTPTETTRTTIHGLSCEFEYLARLGDRRVQKLVAARGLQLEASIVADEEA